MKRLTTLLTFLLLLLGTLTGTAQQQSGIPIGVFTFGGGNSVDYQQMRDSLNLTWIQGYGGVGTEHQAIESNQESLKVISIRNNLSEHAKAQRLEIQAEDGWPSGDWTYAFFGRLLEPTTGGIPEPPELPDTWKASVGQQRGSLANQVRPDDQFHYDRTKYIATFTMKILKSNPATDTVALLSVVCLSHGDTLKRRILYDSSFAASNTYQSIELPFNLELQSNPPTDTTHWLSGGASQRASQVMCTRVDYRIYWYGYRTTWLDRVVVEDTVAYALFSRDGQTSGTLDAVLLDDARDFETQYPLVKRLYLADEPFVNAFRAFWYIDKLIQDSLQLDLSEPARGRAITANYWTDSWINRFIQDAQPNEVMVVPDFGVVYIARSY